MTRVLGPADELRHAPSGDDREWCEVFTLDFVAFDAGAAGSVALVLHPARGACTFWACLVGRDRQFLTIVEPELALPRDLELRAPGLWAEIQCLVPFDHVMFGLEAFAVGLDDPADALGKLWGDRVPFGIDLEWDTASPEDVRPIARTDSHGYEMPCLVHGEVLVADERIEFDGFGSRAHHWGGSLPWNVPTTRVVSAGNVAAALPAGARVEVVAEAPLSVPFGDGPVVRVDRTLAVVHDSGTQRDQPGRVVWIERNHLC